MNHKVFLMLVAATLAILVGAIYQQVLGHEFLHWDDGTYVVANPYINHFDWNFVAWAFTTTYFSYWHPLTWMSHGFDYALWGLQADKHLLTNLVLYWLVTLIVFALCVSVLKKCPDKNRFAANDADRLAIAFLAAALFAVHPQHVEVVAWVSERKELLCTLFALAAVLSYLEYAVRHVRAWLLLSYLCFLLALMCKPMAVSLPAVLILLDLYPLDRLTRKNIWRCAVIEKIPFLLTSMLICGVTIIAQADTGAIHPWPLSTRILNAFNNSFFYLWHWLWPFNLSAFYPFTDAVMNHTSAAYQPVVGFCLLTTVALWAYRRGHRAWLIVWLIYLVTLLPVIGLVHSGPQAAADRYAHLTTIGFYLLFAVGSIRLLRSGSKLSLLTPVLLSALVLSLAWQSYQQAKIWQDDLTLWRSVIERYPDRSSLAHSNLGNAWFERGAYDQAEAQYLKAISAVDGPGSGFDNLATTLMYVGAWERAIALFESLAAEYSHSGKPLLALGDILSTRGNKQGAAAYYAAAIEREPSLARAYAALAELHLQSGHEEQAIAGFEAAIETGPDYIDAMVALAGIYRRQERFDAALHWFVRAYEIAPTHRPVYAGLIECLRAAGLEDRAASVQARAGRLRGFAL